MKTTVSLPDSLVIQADSLAKSLGVSRSRLLQDALAAFINHHNGQSITESINAVIDKNPDAFKLDPAIERMQFERLRKERW